MADMPAVAAQSAVPAGAGNAGTPLVGSASPLGADGCAVPSPNTITNGALITGSAPGSGLQGPLDVGSGGSLTAATYGGDFTPDVRVIDVPGPPKASGASIV